MAARRRADHDHVSVSISPTARSPSARVSGKGDPSEPLLGEEKPKVQWAASWGRLLKESRPVCCRLVLGTVFLLLAAGTSLAVPALFGSVIDALSRGDKGQLQFATVILIIVSAAGAIFSFIRAFLFNSAGQIVVAGLRARLFG
jgi:ABC-type bacteriocin/lantibiotic exporter with double-glycine peptidase domain